MTSLSVRFSQSLPEMMGELFQPHEMPEPPKQSFFIGLFGGGSRSIDREELCMTFAKFFVQIVQNIIIIERGHRDYFVSNSADQNTKMCDRNRFKCFEERYIIRNKPNPIDYKIE